MKKIRTNILNKNIKYFTKPLRLKILRNIGEYKYSPSYFKEWKDTIYSYNNNNIKNLSFYNKAIDKLIKSFFNLYFNKNILLDWKTSYKKYKRKSLNRIHISTPNIKHNNSKIIITLYIFNKEKFSLLNNKLIFKIEKFNKFIKKSYKDLTIFLFKIKKMKILYGKKFFYIKEFQSYIFRQKFIKEFFFKFLKKKILYKLKNLKFKFQLNNSKFKEIYIYTISELISKIYNKKLEFNIINLKSIIFHSDLFTEILSLKLKKKWANVAKKMVYILRLSRIPKVYPIKRKKLYRINSFYLNLSPSLKFQSFETLLKIFYKNLIDWNKNNINIFNLFKNTFNIIKYQDLGGIRLRVKGRLTRRYRADRAVYKLMWRGGLKELDSSYNNFPSIKLRGYINSNVEYSIFKSKRRIGAFAVKGWIIGK